MFLFSSGPVSTLAPDLRGQGTYSNTDQCSCFLQDPSLRVRRYRALKGRVAQTLGRRRSGAFTNKDTTEVLRAAQAALSEDDMDVISHLASKAIEDIPAKFSGELRRRKHATNSPSSSREILRPRYFWRLVKEDAEHNHSCIARGNYILFVAGLLCLIRFCLRFSGFVVLFSRIQVIRKGSGTGS